MRTLALVAVLTVSTLSYTIPSYAQTPLSVQTLESDDMAKTANLFVSFLEKHFSMPASPGRVHPYVAVVKVSLTHIYLIASAAPLVPKVDTTDGSFSLYSPSTNNGNSDAKVLSLDLVSNDAFNMSITSCSPESAEPIIKLTLSKDLSMRIGSNKDIASFIDEALKKTKTMDSNETDK